MPITDRNRQLRVVAELLLVHLPAMLKHNEQALAHDLLAVLSTALREIYDDAQQSARAWDKRAYDVKADYLRREWDWALGASNYALGLGLRSEPVTQESLGKLRTLIVPELECPVRKQIADPARFRGAAQMLKSRQK